MDEPISDTAYYRAVMRRGDTVLFLVRQGTVEAAGPVPVLWSDRAPADPEDPPEPRHGRHCERGPGLLRRLLGRAPGNRTSP